MFKKHNIKFNIISILLTFSLNIGTLAMSPNSGGYKVLESISGLKFKEKLPITRVGNGKSKGGFTKTLISDNSLNDCIQMLVDVDAITSKKVDLVTRWIKHLYHMIITDRNCPSYDFIEKIESIPEIVDQSTEEKHCPYCNEIVGSNKYCSDITCISYWNITRSGFKSYPKSLGYKPGWRERLCLLPTILLKICRDTTIKFYPPAKAWAIHQLMEEKKTEWSYVDKLFDGLSYTAVRVSKIKELLNSAYESITIDDVIDASLYYENFQ